MYGVDRTTRVSFSWLRLRLYILKVDSYDVKAQDFTKFREPKVHRSTIQTSLLDSSGIRFRSQGWRVASKLPSPITCLARIEDEPSPFHRSTFKASTFQ